MTKEDRDQAKDQFLETLAETGLPLKGACKIHNLKARTIRDWRKDDPIFDAAVIDAKEEGHQTILNLATEGLIQSLTGVEYTETNTETTEGRTVVTTTTKRILPNPTLIAIFHTFKIRVRSRLTQF
ncbi:MAG: hypothetical protein ABIV51_12870 [Saprospiraceae bacterium]